tara:strand:+ start:973 stop:2667 length:1695 start_codon:yes stop_codon:yes gene_type:complete
MNKKEMVCYDTDASRLIGKAEKVVFPKTVEEVSKIIQRTEKGVVPRGAGTNLVGGCVPNSSVVVDMSKMNKVSKFSSVKKIVDVEAGVTLKELNEKLSRVGFEFPIESSNKGISTVGGAVALNIPGFRTMKYGRIRDWIESIEFVNGRGEVMNLGKSDLMDVCGMEGITGIITSVVLKVIPKKQRSASLFQADELDELFSIARRLKLEKEVSMLEFFPPMASKLLGLPEKYHLIIEFDSDRGKIKGEEYNVISKFKYKIYDVFYSMDYYNSEDPKFFFDKLKEFILFLESSQIPYFGYLDIGVVHPFFKDNEEEKKKEVIDFIKKVRARYSKYGVGLKRKDLVDSFEKKVLQRIKLRHDPFGKLNPGKIIDLDSSERKYERKFPEGKSSEGKVQHLEPIRKEEIEEIAPLIGEEKGASEILEELKTPEEKMEEFIEKVELMDEIADNEKPSREPNKEDEELEIIKEKEKELEVNREIKDRLRDYESTYKSELDSKKKENIEEFAKNIAHDIVHPKKQIEEDKRLEEKEEKSEEKEFKIDDSDVEKRGKISKEDKDEINRIMFGG